MLAAQQSPTTSSHLVPLTSEEIDDLRERFTKLAYHVGERNKAAKELEELQARKALLAIREAQAGQQIIEARILKEKAQAMQVEGRAMQVEGRAMQADGRAMQADGRAMQANGSLRQADGRSLKDEGRAMQAEGHAIREEAQAQKASGEQKLQAAEAAKKKMVTQVFYAMFNGMKPLSDQGPKHLSEQIDTLFSTYLADGSIFIDMSIKAPRLTSMRPVIQYIEDHPDVKRCTFKPFKTAIEDIPTLADYIAQSSCRIEAIGINGNIPEEAKSSLEAAVAARNGALRVQYLDS